MSSKTKTDTVCPVCWESVHSDEPVGVTTGCGHIWHQSCYRAWKRKGEYQYELSTTTASSEQQQQQQQQQKCCYQLNSNLNCLICNQPTRNFVDLFIRLPSATPDHKGLVTKLEHEFHTVSRRTQLSLEKEIARRDFEQTWLQEERQLSEAAQERARQRHDTAMQDLESKQEALERRYQQKRKRIGARKHSQAGGDGGDSSLSATSDVGDLGGGIRQSFRLEFLRLQQSAGSLSDSSDEGELEPGERIESEEGRTNTHLASPWSGNDLVEERTSAVAAASNELDLMDESTRPLLLLERRDTDDRSLPSQEEATTATSTPNSEVERQEPTVLGTIASSLDSSPNDECLPSPTRPRRPGLVDSSVSPRVRRASRMIQKDTIFHPEEARASTTPDRPATTNTRPRRSRSLPRDEIFLPKTMPIISANTPMEDAEQKLPALEPTTMAEDTLPESSSNDYFKTPAATSLNADYERQRLQAETTYYQHQAELVEWELHQAEIELEQDELDLRQRERQISQERSRLEDSFSSIQRRVEESKQEARDRQALSSMEEKFVTYKIARSKQEERFAQELEHLKEDELHIQERERSEKRRQEAEKIRLKKELNQLVKVMNKLERAKELAKLAEEQSSASQSLETCVVCFDPLVNEDSELGVAVPCGHSFHSACFASWEKSKRRRGSHSVPCPLCNVGTNLCVTIRFNRPGCSLYCPMTSSLAKHFKKEECRWQRQRRRRTGLSMAGEASS